MYSEMQEIVHNEGGALIPMFASYVFAVGDDAGMSEKLATNWDLDGACWWLN